MNHIHGCMKVCMAFGKHFCCKREKTELSYIQAVFQHDHSSVHKLVTVRMTVYGCIPYALCSVRLRAIGK